MPWTFAAIAGAGLSLIGVPSTVGFISKWYLILGALENDWWPVALLIVASSLLAVIYVWKIIEAAYFGVAPEGRGSVAEAPLEMLAPLWLMVVANFYFGIDADLTTSVAGKVAATFLGSGS
jgi:multicomponent Na+:H+ antiporter subunit D